MAPRWGNSRWGGVPAGGGRRSHSRVSRGRGRTGASAQRRRPLLRHGGCRCASGPACGSLVADSAAVAQLDAGGAFPPGGRVKWLLQAAGPLPPEAVGVSLGIGAAFKLVLVALVYVGFVSRPEAMAEERFRRNVLRPIIADVVVSCVPDGVVVGAPDVDPNRAPFASGHQARRTFAYFGGWSTCVWRVAWPCARGLRR